MRLLETALKGLLLIEVDRYEDERGFFIESWQKKRYCELGISEEFVQDNLSYSRYGVLRGLHYQHPHGQGKLVSVIEGEVYDVAVDIRRGSPTFGKYEGYYLSAENRRQLYIPAGFAHGFCVTTEAALFVYKCTDYYLREVEKGLIWNDPDIGIRWPLINPLLSEKDCQNPLLRKINKINLPVDTDLL